MSCKAKNVPAELRGTIGVGSVWTWTALDADSKLMISWIVSERNQEAADALIRDLRSRCQMRANLHRRLPAYFNAILKT